MEKIKLTKKELKEYRTVDVFVMNGDIVCSDVPIKGYNKITTTDGFPITTENNLLKEGEFVVDGGNYVTIVGGAIESLVEENFNKIYGIN